jgi:hypothetical protein
LRKFFLFYPVGQRFDTTQQTTRKPMKHKSNKLLLAVLFGLGLPLSQLQAQTVAAGDLILFFQQIGGNNTVYVNLGSAATNFRGSASGPTADRQNLNIININATLGSAFGPGWASDTSIFAGLGAVRSTTLSSTVVNGDQNQTLYVSRSRTSVGTLGQAGSNLWDIVSGGTLTTPATNILALRTNFATQLPNQAQGVVIRTSSVIDDQNPVNASTFAQGPAFSTFQSGVQQRGSASAFGTFGLAGQVEFALDLNRITPDFDVNTNEVGGPGRQGTYEGTVTVGTDGTVAFITQGSGSAYDAWIAGFPLLDTPTDKLPETDFDNDGFTNLEEFVLNGNPAVSGQAITPTFDVSGANFVFGFTRRDDSTTEARVTFQYGSDLVGWTNVPIWEPSGQSGAAFVTVTPGDAVTDTINVSLPKPVGDRLFGRIQIVK